MKPAKQTLLALIGIVLNLGFGTFNIKAQTGEALDFDGVNDYAIAPLSGTALTELTVSMWINQNTGTSSKKGVFQWANTLSAAPPFIYLYSTSSSFGAYVNNAYPGTLVCTITNGTWTYITLTYKNNTWTLYKDGVFAGAYSAGLGPFQPNAASLYFGNGYNGYWNGKIDEARIWSRALTVCEILNYMNCEISGAQANLMANYHFNTGTAGGANTGLTTLADSSGNGKNGTLTNFTLTGATSNWVAPGAVTSGTSCTAYTLTTISGGVITASDAGATYQWLDCSNGKTAISNATNQSYTVTVTGDYAVIVTRNSCSDTSVCATVDVTSVGEIISAKQLSVYPNPNNGQFKIELEQNAKAQIIIYNTLGEIIYNAPSQQGKHEINISGFANGIYLLKAFNNDQQQFVRIVKQ